MTQSVFEIWLIEKIGQEKFSSDINRLSQFAQKEVEQIQKLSLKVITVAGTNGKGEVSLKIWESLRNFKNCMLWTSPHILKINERFKNSKGDIEDHELEKLSLDLLNELETKEIRLSYYEFLFVVFCRWVIHYPPEILVLEVGMGGRLDAVKLIAPDLVLIPSISRDHQEFLGSTYKEILKEKLAITSDPAVHIISNFKLNYLRELMVKYHAGAKDLSFYFGEIDGNFSTQNSYLASFAIYWVRYNQFPILQDGYFKMILENCLQLRLTGRGEHTHYQDFEVLYYGSHNPDGVRNLIHLLQMKSYNFDQILMSFSNRPLNDLRAMLRILKRFTDPKSMLVTSMEHFKAASKDQLMKLCEEEGIPFEENWENIFIKSKHKSYLVTGSYYFVGMVNSYLKPFVRPGFGSV